MVVVAQLVEPRIVVPVVVGSSPIVHPTIKDRADVKGYFAPALFLLYLLCYVEVE